MPEAVLRSPSGIDPPAEFADALAAAEPGDTLIAVRLDGLEPVERTWGPLLAADHRLLVARLLRTTLRIQDRIGVDAGGDGLLVLLVSGRSEAAPAVFARLRERWEAEGHVGALHARYAIVNDREPIGVTVARASAALADLPRGGGSTLRAA
jgi:hypothetical protein